MKTQLVLHECEFPKYSLLRLKTHSLPSGRFYLASFDNTTKQKSANSPFLLLHSFTEV